MQTLPQPLRMVGSMTWDLSDDPAQRLHPRLPVRLPSQTSTERSLGGASTTPTQTLMSGMPIIEKSRKSYRRRRHRLRQSAPRRKSSSTRCVHDLDGSAATSAKYPLTMRRLLFNPWQAMIEAIQHEMEVIAIQMRQLDARRQTLSTRLGKMLNE